MSSTTTKCAISRKPTISATAMAVSHVSIAVPMELTSPLSTPADAAPPAS